MFLKGGTKAKVTMIRQCLQHCHTARELSCYLYAFGRSGSWWHHGGAICINLAVVASYDFVLQATFISCILATW